MSDISRRHFIQASSALALPALAGTALAQERTFNPPARRLAHV
jgi:hypothetical protein